MPSLFRRPNSQYFYCAFRIPTQVDPDTGKVEAWSQVKKCTKQVERGAALKVALQLEEEARQEAGAGDEVSKKIMSVLREAGELACRRCLSEPLARQFLTRIYEIGNADSLRIPTAREWMEEWFERNQSSWGASTLGTYRPAKAAFLESLGEKADRKLEFVTSTDVRKFRDAVRKGRKAATVNQYLKVIHATFAGAEREGLIRENPASKVKPLLKEDSVARADFSIQQVQAIRRVADADWQTCISIGFYTGWRLCDVTNLRWGQVDLANGKLTVTPKKQRRTKAAKKILVAPIHARLQTILEALPSTDDPDAFLMPSLAGKRAGGKTGLSFAFKDLMKEAGVPFLTERRLPDGSGNETVALSFHSLRHTFVSTLANQGTSAEIRKALTGHTDEAVHEIYTHFSLDQLRGQVATMPIL